MRQPKWVLARDRRSSWNSIEKPKSARSQARAEKHGLKSNTRDEIARELFHREQRAQNTVPRLDPRLSSVPRIQKLKLEVLRLARKVEHIRSRYKILDAQKPKWTTTGYAPTPMASGLVTSSSTFTVTVSGSTSSGWYTSGAPEYHAVKTQLEAYEAELAEKLRELEEKAEIDGRKLAEILPGYELESWLEPRE